jgi:hypothetical protein
MRQLDFRAGQLTKSAGFLGGFAAPKPQPFLHGYYRAHTEAVGQTQQFPGKLRVFLLTRLYLKMKVATA